MIKVAIACDRAGIGLKNYLIDNLNDDYEVGFDSNSFKADITQGLLKNEFILDKFKREY